ncbi:unnamed protein product [Parajaminaea phylloscopi]
MLSFKFAPLAAALVASVAAAPLQRRGKAGQATFYDAGLGACGWTNSGSDKIVAVTYANWAGGANCGKTISITHNGNTQQATIADLCPTCGGSDDLDMSWGLFSALGGTHDMGVFQMQWSMGSDSGSSNNNNNNNNQQKQQKQQNKQEEQKTTSSSSAQPTSTHSASPSSSSAASSTSSPSPKKTSAATSHSVSASRTASTSAKAQATGSSYREAKSTVTGTPAWWASVDDYCGLDSEPKYPVAIAQSKLYSTADLSNACGKAVSLRNPANNKTVEATVVSYLPGAEENYIALGDAYRVLSDDYNNPNVETVEWGFPESS